MKCLRCEGLIVQDQVWDPDEAVGTLTVWRCLNCGETVDWGILKNRQKMEHLMTPVGDQAA